MVVQGAPVASVPATLSENGSKARYGVSYLESICSAAGVPVTEPRPDTDVRAVDCAVAFPEGDVFVQVKCSQAAPKKDADTLRWPVDPGWVVKWSKLRSPIYLLVVRVRSVRPWIEHAADGTLHHAHAIWQRIHPQQVGKSVEVPLDNRFSEATLALWQRDLTAAYGQRPIGGRR